ncbi:RodZ domain-containing protein [Deinococcus sp.]|uniref:RodZ domain-containing protein n=1 Tax=Deinococcus sp. TaxID=47478 RepID=UPI002869E505|nr:RodZ domain-containing protein [Deinococcus sp.]
MSFGSTLKQAREALGLSTQELSLRTKIRGDYLRALEEGNTSLLPERTFARSYLQRYARELNLDPTPLIAEFDRSVPPTPEVAQSLRGAPSNVRPPGVNPGLLAGALTAVIVLGAGGYYAYSTYLKAAPVAAIPAPTPAVTPTPAATPTAVTPPKPAPVPAATTVKLTVKSVPSGARVYLDNRDLGTTPLNAFPIDRRDQAELRVELAGRQPLKQSISLSTGRYLRANLPTTGTGQSSLADLNRPGSAPTVTPAAATPPTDTPAATTPATVAATAPRAAVSVTFAAPSWTRVTGPGGAVLYQGTPPAGSVKGFPKGVVIRTGNAGGVRVSVDGKAATPMGQSGQVVTRAY